MENMRKYNEAINTENRYFKITIKEFQKFLDKEDTENDFYHMVKLAETEEDFYEIAWDFSIPLIMVKWFKRIGF